MRAPLEAPLIASDRSGARGGVKGAMVAGVLTLAAGCVGPGARDSVRSPNVLLILADDIGVECIGCYGGESYATPVIDALAAQGMLFEAAHAQPLCTPSRVELLTGRDHARCYEAFSVLPRGVPTLAQMLGGAGYDTAVAGKWQLLAAEHYREPVRGSGTTPGAAGFDEWCLWQVDKLGKRYHGPLLSTPEGLTQHPPSAYGPDLFVDQLVRFIERPRGRPFFAFYPMALVHDPFVAPPGVDEGDPQQNFAAMVAHMDLCVGRLLAALERAGCAEQTLVVFVGDNGTHRRIRSRWNGREVRGGKNTMTDRGTHVPMIVRWPEAVRAGSRCGDLIDFTDFVPTLCDVAGAAPPPQVDGISFGPQLRGQRGRPREVLTCYHRARPVTRPQVAGQAFARTARYKLYADGRAFDLRVDPDEEGGGAAAVPESVRAVLSAALERIGQR